MCTYSTENVCFESCYKSTLLVNLKNKTKQGTAYPLHDTVCFSVQFYQRICHLGSPCLLQYLTTPYRNGNTAVCGDLLSDIIHKVLVLMSYGAGTTKMMIYRMVNCGLLEKENLLSKRAELESF